jgi:hypothetical protein
MLIDKNNVMNFNDKVKETFACKNIVRYYIYHLRIFHDMFFSSKGKNREEVVGNDHNPSSLKESSSSAKKLKTFEYVSYDKIKQLRKFDIIVGQGNSKHYW